jgi:type II secretory pathway component PulJ
MTRGRQKCKEKGCSLVEAMVALSILSTILAGSLGLFDITERGIAAGAKSLAMTAVVESRMEAWRTIPYQSLLSHDPTGDAKVDLVFHETGSGQFQGQQVIDGVLLTFTVMLDHPVLSRSGVATIKLAAEWDDPRGRHQLVRFGFRRANPVYSGVTP